MPFLTLQMALEILLLPLLLMMMFLCSPLPFLLYSPQIAVDLILMRMWRKARDSAMVGQRDQTGTSF